MYKRLRYSQTHAGAWWSIEKWCGQPAGRKGVGANWYVRQWVFSTYVSTSIMTRVKLMTPFNLPVHVWHFQFNKCNWQACRIVYGWLKTELNTEFDGKLAKDQSKKLWLFMLNGGLEHLAQIRSMTEKNCANDRDEPTKFTKWGKG